MANAISWFELPSNNFQRAVKFYGEVLNTELQPVDMPGPKMAFFPTVDNGVGGCVIHGEGYTPSMEGALVYLNGGDDLSVPLSRVKAAGGEVLVPKMAIGEHGHIAVFRDSEGNRVAFHSIH
jgi:uncharacterized protein